MCIEYQVLNNEEVLKIIKDNCLLIYLGIPEDRFKQELNKYEESKSVKIIETDAFKDRDCLCRNMVDLVVDAGKLDNNVLITKIIDKIVEYYL